MPFWMLFIAIPPAHKLKAMGLPSPLPTVWISHVAPQDRGFDVLSYDVDLRIFPDSGWIEGRNVLRIQRSWADTAYVMLVANYVIDTFRLNGQDVAFQRSLDTLFFPLSGGSEDTLVILYRGSPPSPGYLGGGLYFVGNPVHTVFSDDEPYGLRRWLPALDAPDDKVLLRLTLRVPAGWLVGSNGLPTTVDTTSDSLWIWTWESQYPIASYLIHFAASNNFVLLKDSAVIVSGTQTDTLPIWNFVYTSEVGDASQEFAHLPDMLQYLSSVFGVYPFVGEKYGHTCVLSGWAMENQTMTAYLSDLTPTVGSRDWIIAHELGHQWWGDWVTLGNFDHIWLNEGFATYTEALYIGHRDSLTNPNAYADYINSEMNYYLSSCSSRWDDPILPPAVLFSSCNTYTKAGLVLHMLRGVMGDSLFFEGLRLYGQTFAYSNALTPDFQSVMESVWGSSLDWFFQEWIYAPGFPHYRWGWRQSGNILELALQQIQDSTVAPNVGYFQMPLRIRVVYLDGSDTLMTIWNSAQAFERFTLPVSGVVSDVILDDGNWVLDRQTYDPSVVVEESPTEPIFPTVRIEKVDRKAIHLLVSQGGGAIQVQVLNVAGRRQPVRVVRGAEGRVRLLGPFRPGWYVIRMNRRSYPVVVP